jgi:hypothetical protein
MLQSFCTWADMRAMPSAARSFVHQNSSAKDPCGMHLLDSKRALISQTLFAMVDHHKTGESSTAERFSAKTCFNPVLTHLPRGFFLFPSVASALSLLSSLVNNAKSTLQL